jgi:hypothetical protein
MGREEEILRRLGEASRGARLPEVDVVRGVMTELAAGRARVRGEGDGVWWIGAGVGVAAAVIVAAVAVEMVVTAAEPTVANDWTSSMESVLR